jgi:malonyl CoA-acyl carrier protein transacylase
MFLLTNSATTPTKGRNQMNATQARMTIDEAITEYVAKLTRAAVDHYSREYAAHFANVDVFYEIGPGKVYNRIARCERIRKTGEIITRSAHAFVKREDGTIWKPAGWKGPAKNFARGNVYELADEIRFTHGL